MLSIILNRVAIWSPQMTDGLLIRKAPDGSSYLTKDSMVYKQAIQPLYRYVKNYESGKGKAKVKFCLFVRSFARDDKFVEAELDRIAEDIPADYAKKALDGVSFEQFTYTDFYINDEPTNSLESEEK